MVQKLKLSNYLNTKICSHNTSEIIKKIYFQKNQGHFWPSKIIFCHSKISSKPGHLGKKHYICVYPELILLNRSHADVYPAIKWMSSRTEKNFHTADKWIDFFAHIVLQGMLTTYSAISLLNKSIHILNYMVQEFRNLQKTTLALSFVLWLIEQKRQ